MANPEHVKRLKQGVAEWNAWRKKTRETIADLSGAKLSDAELSGAYLDGAKLTGAYLDGAQLDRAHLETASLDGANLTYARLSGAEMADAVLTDANLSRANLNRAKLIDANLTDAYLHGANLTGANLTGAILASANLSRTILIGADMTDVTMLGTVFGDVDLIGAIGLDMCLHRGPSIIDHQTLQKSGPLPRKFLRGLGLSDKLIEYLSLKQSIQSHSCFISFSTKDQDFADRIYADLQDEGVRCWFAPHDMVIGGKILDEIGRRPLGVDGCVG